MYDQLYPYFDEIFLNFSVIFLKVEQILTSMIEKWWRALDTDDHAEALLTALSKGFDCIYNELLLAKRNGYG